MAYEELGSVYGFFGKGLGDDLCQADGLSPLTRKFTYTKMDMASGSRGVLNASGQLSFIAS